MTTTNDTFKITRSLDADGQVAFLITGHAEHGSLKLSTDEFLTLSDMMDAFIEDCGLRPAPVNLSALVSHYLRRFVPAESISEPGVEIRTTDSILNDLADIADFEPNDIASFLLRAGYITDYAPDGRHGWLMRRI